MKEQSSLSSCFPCFHPQSQRAGRRGHCCLLFFTIRDSLGLCQAKVPLTKSALQQQEKKKGKSNAKVLRIQFPSWENFLRSRNTVQKTLLSLLLIPDKLAIVLIQVTSYKGREPETINRQGGRGNFGSPR